MSYNFTGKTVWITGASSGIGLHVAKQIIQQGANVVVTARTLTKLEQAFGQSDNVLIADGDISQLQVNQAIVSKAVQKFGGIDCVILIAGNAEYIDIHNFDYQPFENMINTNYLSMVKGVQAVLPELRRSKSALLVGMSSSVAWHGLPTGQAYSASKAAIRNLFQGLKIQLRPENIQVSWICPGFVKTPLTDKNTFDMPSIISSEKAGKVIVEQLCKGKTEIHFPKRFTLLLKFISFLPAGLAAKLLNGTLPQ
ncbi:SDR family NAD(P)-dependent oxidoreductase [Aliikangiella sp. IMCC44653]